MIMKGRGQFAHHSLPKSATLSRSLNFGSPRPFRGKSGSNKHLPSPVEAVLALRRGPGAQRGPVSGEMGHGNHQFKIGQPPKKRQVATSPAGRISGRTSKNVHNHGNQRGRILRIPITYQRLTTGMTESDVVTARLGFVLPQVESAATMP